MSNLRHVADLVAGELHHMDVIRGRLFAGRLARTTGTGMSTRKDTVGSDVVALGISGKGLHLTAAVRHNRHLEDGKLTVFKRFVFYAHIRTSDSGKYIWRSLKTTNEQIAVQLGCGLLFQLEQRADQGLPTKIQAVLRSHRRLHPLSAGSSPRQDVSWNAETDHSCFEVLVGIRW